MPVRGVLTGFYMTVVVNIISWDKAYSVFAKDTLIDRKTYMLKLVDAYFETLLQKYNHRGWLLEETMWEEDRSPSSSIQPIRRMGDRFTWTISLPTENLKIPKQPDLVLEYSCFSLNPRLARPHHTTYYIITATPFRHIALGH